MQAQPSRRSGRTLRLLAIAGCLVGMATSLAQPQGGTGRRKYDAPSLVLNTGVPTARTMALAFAADGHLLAGGFDKVVRDWPLAGGRLDRGNRRDLRWAIWRERRGTIFAMALSPDPQQRQVAVGGLGLRPGGVAVLDRQTGAVLHGWIDDQKPTDTVWSLCFAPDGGSLAIGTDDGGVWLWDLLTNKLDLLGRHTLPNGSSQRNRIQAVAFAGPGEVAAIARDGSVRLWATAGGGGQALPPIAAPAGIAVAAFSPDGQTLAAGHRFHQEGGREVLRATVRPLRSGQPSAELTLNATCVAFAASGQQVVFGGLVRKNNAVTKAVYLYDLTSKQAREFLNADFAIDAVALSADGATLAVAGGENFEIDLWDVPSGQRRDRLTGPGRAIRAVRLDAQGRLGIKTDLAERAYRIFDLKGLRWVPAPEFRPLEPVETMAGWRVTLAAARLTNPRGETLAIPEIDERTGAPQCHMFLPPQPGSGQAGRLVLGHQYGFSIYGLFPTGAPVLLRRGTGHEGQVIALAASADGQLIVTGSDDQTVCGWSLAPWEHHPELGCAFVADGPTVKVAQVADGSPAWEAGLTAGDRLDWFAFGGFRELFDPVNQAPAFQKNLFLQRGGKIVTQPQALARLAQPIPGLQLEMKMAGEAEHLYTSVRQRPLWRFFPAADNEWVLWRWRDHFYATSAIGDSYIGWQLSKDINDTPQFVLAEQLRQRFNKPEKLEGLMTTMLSRPDSAAVPELAPPKVELTQVAPAANGDLQFQVRVVPPEGLFAEIDQITLWVNDHRFFSRTPRVEKWMSTIAVPRRLLRQGAGQNNLIVAQAYANGARGDSQQIAVPSSGTGGPGRLFGLSVGVSRYSDKSDRAVLLFPELDAQKINGLLDRQAGYAEKKVTPLFGADATPENIRGRLAALADQVQADDVLVLYLSGHGDNSSGAFYFCGYDFTPARAAETGLSARDLADLLAVLPCRKVVMLDACFSGGSTDFIRQLMPDSVGPVVLTAASDSEEAIEDRRLGGGVFTYTVLEAASQPVADVDRNGALSPTEIHQFADSRMIVLFDALKFEQGLRHAPQIYLRDRADTQIPLFTP